MLLSKDGAATQTESAADDGVFSFAQSVGEDFVYFFCEHVFVYLTENAFFFYRKQIYKGELVAVGVYSQRFAQVRVFLYLLLLRSVISISFSMHRARKVESVVLLLWL